MSDHETAPLQREIEMQKARGVDLERKLKGERALADDLAAEVEHLQQEIIDICENEGLDAPIYDDAALVRWRKAREL